MAIGGESGWCGLGSRKQAEESFPRDGRERHWVDGAAGSGGCLINRWGGASNQQGALPLAG